MPKTPVRIRKMLSMREVVKLVPVHPNTIARWVKDGKFPAPRRADGQHPLWFEDEVLEWQREQRRK